jgi:hypothetical protein
MKYFRVLQKELRARNFQLMVILVPSKYTVYQPLIKDAAKTNKSEALDELQKDLQGVPVVNTTPALRQAAADGIEHGKFLYWRDDTHWNADGVRVAADQIHAQYESAFPVRGVTKITSISQQRAR